MTRLFAKHPLAYSPPVGHAIIPLLWHCPSYSPSVWHAIIPLLWHCSSLHTPWPTHHLYDMQSSPSYDTAPPTHHLYGMQSSPYDTAPRYTPLGLLTICRACNHPPAMTLLLLLAICMACNHPLLWHCSSYSPPVGHAIIPLLWHCSSYSPSVGHTIIPLLWHCSSLRTPGLLTSVCHAITPSYDTAPPTHLLAVLEDGLLVWQAVGVFVCDPAIDHLVHGWLVAHERHHRLKLVSIGTHILQHK